MVRMKHYQNLKKEFSVGVKDARDLKKKGQLKEGL